MFRYVLYFLLFITLVVYFINKSISSTNEIIKCYDDFSANNFEKEFPLAYTPAYRQSLCKEEKKALELYNLCYKQVSSIYAKTAFIDKIAALLSEFFRPELDTPSYFASAHNANCLDYPELQLKNIL